MRAAIRAGVARGLVELRQSFSGAELVSQLLWPVATLVAVYFLRDREVHGAPLGAFVLPGALGMFVAFGMLLIMERLTVEREDGTLLRARATPHGIRAYFTGKLVMTSGAVLVYLAIVVVPGAFLVDGLRLGSPGAWLTLAWVLALGLVATQSIGAVLGALIRSSRAASLMSFPALALFGISGIFYPVTALPDWLQWVAQAFPVYWLGLGMRAALLPDAMAAVEVAGSWRQAETFAVLGAWAVAGLAVAPVVLRRMARRESGSRLAHYKERALRRVG